MNSVDRINPHPSRASFFRRLGRIRTTLSHYHREPADAYRDLLIQQPDLQPETIARLFW